MLAQRVAKFSLVRRGGSRNECEYMRGGTREIDCLCCVRRVCEKRDRRKRRLFAGEIIFRGTCSKPAWNALRRNQLVLITHSTVGSGLGNDVYRTRAAPNLRIDIEIQFSGWTARRLFHVSYQRLRHSYLCLSRAASNVIRCEFNWDRAEHRAVTTYYLARPYISYPSNFTNWFTFIPKNETTATMFNRKILTGRVLLN